MTWLAQPTPMGGVIRVEAEAHQLFATVRVVVRDRRPALATHDADGVLGQDTGAEAFAVALGGVPALRRGAALSFSGSRAG